MRDAMQMVTNACDGRPNGDVLCAQVGLTDEEIMALVDRIGCMHGLTDEQITENLLLFLDVLLAGAVLNGLREKQPVN